MLRTAMIWACVVFAASATCLAQVKLEQKLPEGATYTVETSTKLEQKLTIAGMDIDTAGDTRTTVKSTIGTRDAEGKLRAEDKVESLQISMKVMGQEYVFDSNNADNKGGSPLEILRDVHKALAAQSTTKVFDKFDRVVAVETDENILQSVPEQLRGFVQGSFNPETLKQAANQARDQITSDPVKPGDTWQRTETSDFGAGQLMSFETEYTYQGTEEKGGKTLDKITSKAQSVKFSFDNGPIPLKLKSSDLKVPESEGLILFDRERGQIVESDSKMRITGEMVFAVNDMELPAKVDLKIHTTTLLKP